MSIAADDAPATRTLRIHARRVVATGPASLLERTLGPLATLAHASDASDEPTSAAPAIAVVVRALAPAEAPPDRRPRATTWRAGPPPQILADGVGVATIPADGPVDLAVRADVPDNDLAAERLAIPALGERLRREGLHLLHAACLLAPDRRGVWLVPAARGSGKTTLSLTLVRHGFGLLSDDRGFLAGDTDGPDGRVGPTLDPWPEAPRVGDRSLYLLPPHLAAGPRDEAMGKASVPGLLPPRLPRALPVVGFLLPCLVAGRGGDVATVRGAAALAPIASQAVVVTDPATASATLATLTAALGARPCFRVTIGDDPARLAAALADALGARSARAEPAS